QMYPKAEAEFAVQPGDIPNLDEPSPVNRDTVELWCYWDETTEAVLFGSEVLFKGPNLYGQVPLYFLEGEVAPESEFSLGDYDTATGLQEMLARLQSQINDQAENGGAIGWYNGALLPDGSKQAFEDGRPSGFVEISGGGAEDVFGYVSGQQMSPALLEAFRMAQQGLDSVTGVNEYQRGVINNSVKFATEAAMLANQSGARGNQARIVFEQFIDRVAKAVLKVVLKFGPALMEEQASPEDMMLFAALTGVTDICVLEGSTAYKDPVADMQSSLQLLQVMMPFIQAGLVNPLPMITDVFRAFGKRDVGKYVNSQAATQNGMQGAASSVPTQPMPPGGPPQPAGAVAPGPPVSNAMAVPVQHSMGDMGARQTPGGNRYGGGY
ncbi:MAG TPA: hypothetical protein VKU00_00700, partial [Chthonomonadaceae bacterium]|nr:hypothetical protein [Chthonomonadaceae bacterium]